MFDLRKYWQEIRAIEAALPDYLWIVDAAGTLIEVTAHIGAKLLHARSHRVATEEEIQAQAERNATANRESERASLRKRGVEVISVK